MNNWKEEIRTGMRLIMKGCQKNESWRNCSECPFDKLCTSIYKDESHHFSTPDTWEEEGVFLKLEE